MNQGQPDHRRSRALRCICRHRFPENVAPFYPYYSFIESAYQIVGGREHLKLLDQVVTAPSPVTHAISEACKQAGVVVSISVNERDGETLYNTQLLFDAD